VKTDYRKEMDVTERDHSFLPERPGTQPEYLHPPYVSSHLRAPRLPLIVVPQTLSELSGPVFGDRAFAEFDNDLTRQHTAEPIGERIIVSGRVLDENERPVRNALVEVWQANAAGRYRHKVDQHDAPLDPNFSGAGRFSPMIQAFTDSSPSSREHTHGETMPMHGARRTFTFPCLAPGFSRAW
jgi:protocatechuate 3,4-dioxygenase beta subunit